jgi:hypothetical protein
VSRQRILEQTRKRTLADANRPCGVTVTVTIVLDECADHPQTALDQAQQAEASRTAIAACDGAAEAVLRAIARTGASAAEEPRQ